jgi:hypothetical protein
MKEKVRDQRESWRRRRKRKKKKRRKRGREKVVD